MITESKILAATSLAIGVTEMRTSAFRNGLAISETLMSIPDVIERSRPVVDFIADLSDNMLSDKHHAFRRGMIKHVSIGAGNFIADRYYRQSGYPSNAEIRVHLLNGFLLAVANVSELREIVNSQPISPAGVKVLLEKIFPDPVEDAFSDRKPFELGDLVSFITRLGDVETGTFRGPVFTVGGESVAPVQSLKTGAYHLPPLAAIRYVEVELEKDDLK